MKESLVLSFGRKMSLTCWAILPKALFSGSDSIKAIKTFTSVMVHQLSFEDGYLNNKGTQYYRHRANKDYKNTN